MDWQPIETAPKDGTSMLLVWGGDVIFGYWHEHRKEWVADESQDDYGFGMHDDGQPTHWMPIPPPPKE